MLKWIERTEGKVRRSIEIEHNSTAMGYDESLFSIKWWK
jgi:hypothetical protein